MSLVSLSTRFDFRHAPSFFLDFPSWKREDVPDGKGGFRVSITLRPAASSLEIYANLAPPPLSQVSSVIPQYLSVARARLPALRTTVITMASASRSKSAWDVVTRVLPAELVANHYPAKIPDGMGDISFLAKQVGHVSALAENETKKKSFRLSSMQDPLSRNSRVKAALAQAAGILAEYAAFSTIHEQPTTLQTRKRH